MTRTRSLADFRQKHAGFEALPETLSVSPIPPRRTLGIIVPIEEARLDDIAFAVAPVEAEFDAVADRLHALKRLYRLARRSGALGADRAFEAVMAEAR